MSNYITSETINLCLEGLLLFVFFGLVIKIIKHNIYHEMLPYTTAKSEESLLKAQKELTLVQQELKTERETHKLLEISLKRKLDYASTLALLGQQGLGYQSLSKFMDEVVNTVQKTLKVDYCKIAELLPNKSSLLLKFGTGWQAGIVGFAQIEASKKSHASYTLESNQPVIIKNLTRETRFTPSPLLDNHQIISGISLKITSSDPPFGFIAVYTRLERIFTNDEIEFLEKVSQILGYAVEKERAQKRLELLERAINASNNGIVITDAQQEDNPVLYINRGFERMTGYSAQEIIGQNCRFLQKNDREQPEINILRQCIKEGQECNLTIRNYRKDSTLFWNQLYIAPVYDQQGHLTHFIGIQTDVTEHKQAEQERDRFFSLSIDLLCIVGFDGYFKRLNLAWETTLGYSIEELLARPYLEVIHPDDREATLAAIGTLATDKTIECFENRYQTQDGSYRWFAWKAIPYIQEGLIYAVAQDITERKRTLIEIQQTRNFLQTMIEHLPLAVFVKDGRRDTFGQLILWNKTCERMFGISTEQAIGSTLYDYFPSTQADFFAQKDREAFSRGIPLEILEEPINSKALGKRLLHTLKIPLYDEQTQPQYLLCISEDITARKQIENALKESQAQLNSILGSLKDIVWSVSLSSSQYIYLNTTVEEIYGRSVSEFLNDPHLWLDIIHPEDRSQVEQIARELLESKTSKDIEYRIIRPDGQLRWLRDRAQVIYDEQGNPIRLDGIATDITEQKRAEEALKKSEEQFRLMFEHSPTGIALATPEGRLVKVNPVFCQMMGYTEAELLKRTCADLTYPDDLKEEFFWYQKLLAGEISNYRLEKRYLTRKGSILHGILQVALIRDEPGTPLNLIAQVVDITHKTKAEIALRESEHRLSRIITTISDGLIVVDDEGKIKFINPATERLFGRTRNELIDQHFGIPFVDEKTTEICLRHADGNQILIVEMRVSNIIWEQQRGYLISLRDITERKFITEQLQYNATHDPLTHLLNRVSLLEKLQEKLKENQNKSEKSFAVLFLDLDDFKVVNDSLGHMAGDQLLIAIAERLQSSIIGDHTLARFGGDEFTILLENIQESQEAIIVAEKIHYDLTRPYDLNGQQVFINTSIGIAVNDPSYSHPQEILRDADTAMYQAKRGGKGCYALFNQQMHQQAVKRLQLEIELRKAIEKEEFLIHYQPIFSLTTGYLTGFEALMRWQHPQKGLVSPAEFIPIAEETGLIVQMGKWMILEACRQLKLWQDQYSLENILQISVNLSSKQLRDIYLVQEIDQILAQTGLNPKYLKLEITESMLMENVEIAMKSLIQLRERNIELCLDDFGTGYSSLSYLHRFPVSIVKIDRSFVMQMKPGNRNAEIVRAIITLAHTLNMAVTAEGIETQLQLSQLKWLECEQGQGYLFSKPLPQDAAEAFIKDLSSSI